MRGGNGSKTFFLLVIQYNAYIISFILYILLALYYINGIHFKVLENKSIISNEYNNDG